MKVNQKGFSVVEILIVIVVVGLLGAVSWLVYDRQNNKTDSSSNQTTQQNQVATEPEAKKETDPYIGWKQYCDDKSSLCFKYPTDWKVEQQSYDAESSSAYASVVSPTETARVVYQTNSTRDGGTLDVTPVKLADSSNFAGYSIAGTFGVYLGKPRVVYDVVKGTVEENGFKVGQATQLSSASTRFDYNGNITEVFGTPTDYFANETEAKAWFDSTDGKTVLLILQSFSKK